MSAIDDYLQLLNNNPKADTTGQWLSKLGNNVKTGIEDSLPKGVGPTAMLDYASNVNPIVGIAGNILSWHGSPHKFTKFKDKAIGTGEGQAAFGDGHYSGEEFSVLDDWYRRRLAEMSADNSPLERFIADPKHKNIINEARANSNKQLQDTYPNWSLLEPGVQKSIGAREFNNTISSIFGRGQLAKTNDKFSNVYDDTWGNVFNLSKNYIPPPPSKGYLYQLNLKPDKGDLLDFGKNFTEHPKQVQQKILSAAESEPGAMQRLLDYSQLVGGPKDSISQLYGEDLYRHLNYNGKASKNLLDQGIPGHTFDGQGGRGLPNYVMYNPEDIQIMRRIKSGLATPRPDSPNFGGYPGAVSQIVNKYNIDPSQAVPRGLIQRLSELQNSNLKDIEW